MERPKYLKEIKMQFAVHKVCALLGPRQVGKTTLARMYTKGQAVGVTLDLENPFDLARLENPLLTLSKFPGQLVVIDEVQRRPELFPVLRVLVDGPDAPRFLILGSASRDLIQQSSETLAGRIGYIELTPFSLKETGEMGRLWLRGGFPPSFLARNNPESFLWRQSYISTFLERDIPNLGFQIPAQQLRRFWMMLAHYHGQIFNANELATSLGVSGHTIRKYLDILAGTFMVRILLPWFENVNKRQVKSPKIYFRDSGILHALLGIREEGELDLYPKMGSFWEGFVLEELIRQTGSATEECFFWAVQSGAELNLLIVKGRKRIGFEIKYSETPQITASMRTALELLKLDHLYVVHPGKGDFPLDKKITACALTGDRFTSLFV